MARSPGAKTVLYIYSERIREPRVVMLKSHVVRVGDSVTGANAASMLMASPGRRDQQLPLYFQGPPGDRALVGGKCPTARGV
jgi:hypothetical protein